MLRAYKAQVRKKRKIAPNVYFFQFKLIYPKSITFKPGQYFLLHTNDTVRHYSFSNSPTQKDCIDTIVDVSPMGIGSKFLLGLKLNDYVSLRAPLGQFFLQLTNKPKIFS